MMGRQRMEERELTGKRTLVLMRHAKSAYPGGVRDHDRPLADRGRREAALAGDWLRAEVAPVDEVLTSTSVRTQQTIAALLIDAPIRLAASIYEAAPQDILAQIRLTASTVTTLLVVGHGPGMPGLAMELAGPTSEPAALAGLQTRFPTSAIAVLETDIDWAQTDLGDGRLIAFHIPRP
jgi:phosphohistidine phosphatase